MFQEPLSTFMLWCLENHGKEIILDQWVPFCVETGVTPFDRKCVESAFDDEKLYQECMDFAKYIGEKAKSDVA